MNPLSPVAGPRWRRALTATLLLAASALAWAQADPPARVAYVSALEGAVRISTDAPDDWAPASLNWPVTTGTRLQLDPGARAELDGGWLALRLQGPADLDTSALDDTHTQWALTAGTASLRVRQPPAGERVELDTPQLALVATQPGEYRLDVGPASDTTRVTVRSGSATLYGQAGQSMPVAAGQQIVLTGRDLTVLSSAAVPPRDAFGQWVAARERQRTQSPATAYVSPDMPGYAQLDAYGQWSDDATYGPVWYPAVTAADWAPYRDGRWVWVSPWGWTWVDDAPWGFAPFHYGRWTQIGPRWAWVPGPVLRRPVYAPALVQFVGAGSGWRLSAGGPGMAWFPLAPGERWHPPYHASERYRDRLNDWGHWRGPVPAPGGSFFFQHRPGAISVAPQGGFDRDGWRGGRRPRYGDGSHLPPGWMQGSRPSAPPERPPRAPAHAERPQPLRSPVPPMGVMLPRPPAPNGAGPHESTSTPAWTPGQRPPMPQAGFMPPMPHGQGLHESAPAAVQTPGPRPPAPALGPEHRSPRAERPMRPPEPEVGRPAQHRPEWAPTPQARPAAPAWRPPQPALSERPAERPQYRPEAYQPRPAREFAPPARQFNPSPDRAPRQAERGPEREHRPAPQHPRATRGDNDR
ncbi:DUF6600 domain-containing protein [Ottowia pentelensis]|uniref:DUF6600 domain-containing protein n=1 Tax=Ottowia pentelensis TaxID=511108 RepID=A0ABV6PU98_9BURK